MKILQEAKNIFGTVPLLAKFLVNKTFSFESTGIEGKLQLIAKVECEVVRIEYEITESFETAHNNATENKVYSLGTLVIDKSLKVSPLEAQLLEFTIPLKMDNGSSGDESVYSGDMALMNKFSDKAKRTSSKFKITANINVKDYPKTIHETATIKFK